MSPKSVLAAILVVGFLVSIPGWLSKNQEEKQHLSETAVKEIVKQNVGLLEIEPKEREELKQLLKPAAPAEETDFEQVVWQKDIVVTIAPWVSDPNEAATIAHWVYVYSKRQKLSPELILGLIAVESLFDHFAVSNVGAVGLMQVMPFWKKELGSPDDNLLSIETNVRYGCAIIRHYLDRYKTLDRALGAYNGSLGSMRYPNKVYAKMKRFKAVGSDVVR